MLRVKEEEFNFIIHDLLSIASILRNIENGSLTEGHKQILHGCETRLAEIRNQMLESIENDNGGK